MADNKPETHVIISYVPLLRGNAGKFIDASVKTRTANFEADLKKMMDEIQPYFNSDSGHVEGISWMNDEEADEAVCLLMMHNADAVLDHLNEWAEGIPQHWFNLHLYEANERYAIALMPNFDASVQRYRAAMKLVHGIDVPMKSHFQLLFRPIVFDSKPGATTYAQIKHKIGKRLLVQAIDHKFIKPDPQGADIQTDKIRDIGRFRIHRNDSMGYLEQLLSGDHHDNDN